jgi:hypothetical protein
MDYIIAVWQEGANVPEHHTALVFRVQHSEHKKGCSDFCSQDTFDSACTTKGTHTSSFI